MDFLFFSRHPIGCAGAATVRSLRRGPVHHCLRRHLPPGCPEAPAPDAGTFLRASEAAPGQQTQQRVLGRRSRGHPDEHLHGRTLQPQGSGGGQGQIWAGGRQEGCNQSDTG